MQDIKDQENMDVSSQWKLVCDEFKQYYTLKEFKDALQECECEIEKNTAIIIARTRFQKERLVSDYKQNLKMFWYKVNRDIRDIEITVGRRKFEGTYGKAAEIIQLPLWAEQVRGTPNSALRGSLFAAIDPRKRKALERKIIVDEKHLKIIFTGIQLDQSDKDVWEQALHMVRQQPLGQEIYFSARSFLKALGKTSIGKSQNEWLKKSFARLLGCAVEITHNGHTYGGSLLEFEREEATQRYKLAINPKIMKLYDAGWTQNDFEDRKRIGSKKFLALWLQGYISSHVDIFPMRVETFLRLSGSGNKSIYAFKQKLIEALTHLKTLEIIEHFYIKNNLIYIEKKRSNSQIRHLDSAPFHDKNID